MAENNESDDEVAAAIRELAHQVGTLGNAVAEAGNMIAKAIKEGINIQVAPQPGPY